MAKQKQSSHKNNPTTIGNNNAGLKSIQWYKWAVLALPFLLYSNTLFYDFAQDDSIVITDNMFTKDGLAGLKGIWGKDTFFGFFKEEGKAGLVSGGRYRPLSLTVFALIYDLSGGKPFLFHLVGVLFYCLLCFVIFRLIQELLRHRFKSEVVDLIALLGTLFYAAHPIHTEAVANIKGLDETLSMLLACLSLFFALRFSNSGDNKNLLLIFLSLLGGMLSKENAITFLAVIPLAIYYFTNQGWNGVVKPLAAAFSAVVVFLLIRGAVIGWQFGDAPKELMNNPFLKWTGTQYIPFNAAEKLATVFYTLWVYVKLLILPYPLTHDYYPRHIEIMNFGSIGSILGLLIYGFMAFWFVTRVAKKELSGFLAGFYLITISIVSNILFPIGTNMSERFIFMPSFAFCLLLAIVIVQFMKNSRNSSLAIGCGIVAIYGIMTISRNGVWKDNLTLFTTDVKTSVNSAKLQNSVGGELLTTATKTQDSLERRRLADEAIPHLEKAISIHPTYHIPYLLKGNAQFLLGNFDEAIKNYDNCLNLNPGYSDAIRNRTLAYREAGKYFGEKKGDLGKAIFFLEKAQAENPKDYETNRLLGVANGISGNKERAIQFFLQAADINPSAEALKNVSIAYANGGNKEKAEEFAQKSNQAPALQSGQK